MNKKILLFLLLTIPACKNDANTEKNDSKKDSIIYDLDESTEIIMQLIKQNAIKEILAEEDSKNIEQILKNFSPSEMAMEAEALNYRGTCAVIFFNMNENWHTLKDALIEIAQKHRDIKFVQVNADSLFKVTQNAQVEHFPALIFIKERKEIARIEPLKFDSIKSDFENEIAGFKKSSVTAF